MRIRVSILLIIALTLAVSLGAGMLLAAPTTLGTQFPLYVPDSPNHRIMRVSSTGAVTEFVSGDLLNYPSRLAFNADGDLFVADVAEIIADGSKIIKITSAGVQSTFVPPNSGITNAQGLAFASNGDLYVSDATSPARIVKVTSSGVPSEFASGDKLSTPVGLAFDGAGNLYVADADSGVIKITPGATQSEFATPGPDPLIAIALDVAFDTNGNLYVASRAGKDPPDSAIVKVTPAGVQSNFATGDLIVVPSALAFDSAGNLYVGDTTSFTPDANIIIKLDSNGNQTPFATGLNFPAGLTFSLGSSPASSPTPTGTSTLTATPTPTVNGTSTPTLTPSSTATASPTPTASVTSTATTTSTSTPTRTATAAASTTVTSTPTLSAPAQLNGTVSFQGRGTAPDPWWQVPLKVTFSQSNPPLVLTAVALSTNTGSFTVDNIPPGTYDVRVKHAQSLSSQIMGVILTAGASSPHNFGELATGDADNSDQVDILDFSLLRAAFGQGNQICGTSNPSQVPCADLDATGLVDIVDFSLLRSTFGRTGPTSPAT